jgi:hypothetical protein
VLGYVELHHLGASATTSTPLSKLRITSATPGDACREGGSMPTDYFSAPSALARHRNTAFGGYLDGFAAWLADQGYKGEKIRVAIQNVTALGLWLPDNVASQMLDENVLGRYDAHLRRIGRFKHASGRYFSFSTGPRQFLK